MSSDTFSPTPEQNAVVLHDGSAFVEACPGAGKTQVMIERARRLLRLHEGGGVAFLSYTTAATGEMETRLQRERLLPTPSLPHFLGTFDSFVWKFFIAPFGIKGCDKAPQLIPELGNLTVGFGRKYPLKCFCPLTGNLFPEIAAQEKLKPQDISSDIKRMARSRWAKLMSEGKLDFAAIRRHALELISDPDASLTLSRVLSARFKEVIVDEAQDCNLGDLEIIAFLKRSGIRITIVCDPDQAIYGFRGSAGATLRSFSEKLPDVQFLSLSGNFRSSANICKASSAFRLGARPADVALGSNADSPLPVYVISYAGRTPPPAVGREFWELIKRNKFKPATCPVLASGWNDALNACGSPPIFRSGHLVLKIASIVSHFHAAADSKARKKALLAFHQAVVSTHLTDNQTYQDWLVDQGVDDVEWRAQILPIIQSLKYEPTEGDTPQSWLERARTTLSPLLAKRKTPAQHLRSIADLEEALAPVPARGLKARSIHSVKGEEFPAVCVVMGVTWAKSVLNALGDIEVTSEEDEVREEIRKFYVGCSRAQKMLAIAVPKSQKKRLLDRLSLCGVKLLEV